MIITENTLGGLTLNTRYSAKFGYLQRFPNDIKVTGVSSGVATVEFYENNVLSDTKSISSATVTWIIDLTQ